LTIAAVGEAWCFLIDAVSYVAVIASLLAMHLAARPLLQERARVLDELRGGFGYVFGFAPVRELLLNVAPIGILGMPYAVLMPVFAAKILGGGAHTQGLLMTASGAGALLGTVYLASRHSVVGLGKVIGAMACILAGAWFAFRRPMLAEYVRPIYVERGILPPLEEPVA
jgi:hypothetical protein